MSDGGGFVITGRERMVLFNLQQIKHGLMIQRDTGLKHSRGSLITLARTRYGTTSRTVKGTIAEIEAIIAIKEKEIGL